MGFFDKLMHGTDERIPDNFMECHKQLSESLIKCREYQDKNRYEKCLSTFNTAQEYFNKLFALLNQASLSLEFERNIDKMCSYIEQLKSLCTSYYSWPPYFNLDFSNDEDNTFAYLNHLHGYVLADGEKYHTAIQYLEKSLTYNCSHYNSQTYTKLGEIYLALEKYGNALSSYNKSIKFLWENPEAWSGKALALLELKRFDEAKSSAEVALELSSNRDGTCYLEAKIAYAYALCALGEYEKLLRPSAELIDYISCVPSDVLDSEAKKSFACVYYIRYLALKGTNTPGAASVFEKALSYYPTIESTEEGRELKSAFEAHSRRNTHSESDLKKELPDTANHGNDKLSDMLSKLNGNSTDKSLNDILQELNSLIGLSSVKREVEGLVNVVKNRKRREELGLKQPEFSLHMVFSGNPGTGKTTVARLIAEIYHELGLISEGQLVEVDRSKLVAGYVGQTAIQTKEVIDSAIGGVLFIDEAYTLSNDKSNGESFGQEAVDTLLKSMEDNRDNLIVIVAGYPDLMKEFLASNPGLESRFNTYIHFDDYSASELLELLKYNCKKNEMVLSPDAEKYAEAFFEKRCENLPPNFANGRYVRNIFEKMCRNQDNRVAKLSKPTRNDLITLTLDDFEGIAL